MLSLILSLILSLAGGQARGAPVRPPLPAADRVSTERIAGTVIRAETLRPFSHARVELRREDYGRRLNTYEKPCGPGRDVDNPQLLRTVLTDEFGRFSFEHIIPGRYYVVAQHEGYVP